MAHAAQDSRAIATGQGVHAECAVASYLADDGTGVLLRRFAIAERQTVLQSVPSLRACAVPCLGPACCCVALPLPGAGVLLRGCTIAERPGVHAECTVASCRAEDGAGVLLRGFAVAGFRDSTFVNNSAILHGAAVSLRTDRQRRAAFAWFAGTAARGEENLSGGAALAAVSIVELPVKVRLVPLLPWRY